MLFRSDMGMVEASQIEFLIVSENESRTGSLKESAEMDSGGLSVTDSWLDQVLYFITLLKGQYIQIGKSVMP